MNRFPASPEALTTEWLSEHLGADVSGFKVERFGEGVGIISAVMRIHFEGDLPYKTAIAKFPSPSEDTRGVAQLFDLYQREVHFYRDIADNIDVTVPRCYYADHDPETNEFLMLLEDVADRYRIGDQVAGCTYAEAEQVLASAARMHASGWGENSFGVWRHDNPTQIAGMQGGAEGGWPVVLDQFRDLVPAKAVERGHKLPAAIPGLLDEMCQPPVSLIHCDVRLDNIFFGADDVCLVDWQAVCMSAPEQDVAYFITQSVPRDVQAEGDLRDFYFRELMSHGVDYSRAAFDRRYTVSALYLMSFAVMIAGTLDLGNDRGQQLGRTLLGASLAALDELDAYELL